MSRTVEDFDGPRFPPPGQYEVICTEITKEVSKQKHTPYAKLTLRTANNDTFSDSVFLTAKALNRVAMVASRLCGLEKDVPLPDDDITALDIMEEFIMQNAVGKVALVTIEEVEEVFMVQEGPDVGQKKTTKKRRVAFRGYDRCENPTLTLSDLPF